MKEFIRECPKCKNYTKGQVVETTSRRVTKSVSKNIVMAAANFVTLGGASIAEAVNGPHIKKSVEDFVDELVTEGDVTYTCVRCGHTWTEHFTTDTDSKPLELAREDEIRKEIKAIKDEDNKYKESISKKEFEISNNSSNAVWKFIFLIPFAIAAFFTVKYFWVNDWTYTEMQETSFLGFNKHMSEVHVYNWNKLWSLIGAIITVPISFWLCTSGFDSRDKASAAKKELNSLKTRYKDFLSRNQEIVNGDLETIVRQRLYQ